LTGVYADAYAILAFLAGDDAFGRRLRGADVRTGLPQVYDALRAQLNLDVHPEEAQRNVAPFLAAALPIEVPDVLEAARWLREHRAAGGTATPLDAIGYAQARRLGRTYLTGEGRLRGLHGVEVLMGRSARRDRNP
jgi:hypothetical protein